MNTYEYFFNLFVQNDYLDDEPLQVADWKIIKQTHTHYLVDALKQNIIRLVDLGEHTYGDITIQNINTISDNTTVVIHLLGEEIAGRIQELNPNIYSTEIQHTIDIWGDI